MNLKEDLLFFESPQNVKKAAQQTGIEEGTPAETAERLAAKMLEPAYMKRRFSILRDDDIRYFRIAASQKKRPAAANYASADRIMDLHYGFVTDSEGDFEIPSDVYEVFQKIDTPSFEKERAGYSWTYDCLFLMKYFYAVIHKTDFCRFYRVNRKRREEDPEIMAMAGELISSRLCEAHEENDELVRDGIDEKSLEKIRELHAAHPFVLPPYSLMKDLLEYSWPRHDPRWNTLRKYCLQNLAVSTDFINGLMEGIWMNVAAGASFDQILEMMKEESVIIPESEMQNLRMILTDCWLHTPMSLCNGSTPYAAGLNPQIFLIHSA